MADFPNSTTAPEILRPIIESEIERLITILDGMDADPDMKKIADAEPSLGSIEVKVPLPVYRMGGGHGHCLFPALYREHGELTYISAGFQQLTWSVGADDDREDEHDGAEPCCEDEGAQCDDEGARAGA